MISPKFRITARRDGTDAGHVSELKKRGGLPASGLMRETQRECPATRMRARANALKVFGASGIVGGGERAADLSAFYKSYLAEALQHKSSLRVQEDFQSHRWESPQPFTHSLSPH